MTWTGIDGREIHSADSLDRRRGEWQATEVFLRRESRQETRRWAIDFSARKNRVRDFAEYEKKLRANGVIVRPAERGEKIERAGRYMPRGPGIEFTRTRTCCVWSPTSMNVRA